MRVEWLQLEHFSRRRATACCGQRVRQRAIRTAQRELISALFNGPRPRTRSWSPIAEDTSAEMAGGAICASAEPVSAAASLPGCNVLCGERQRQRSGSWLTLRVEFSTHIDWSKFRGRSSRRHGLHRAERCKSRSFLFCNGS